MAKYGRKRYRSGRSYRKRSRKGYTKSRYSRYKSRRSKLFRTSGNFAAGKASQVEQKSLDLAVISGHPQLGPSLGNWFPTAGPWVTLAGTAAQGSFLAFTGVSGTTSNSPAAQLGDACMLLNACTQGADINNRLGRKITMRSIYLRITVHAPGTWSNVVSSANTFNCATSTASMSRARLLVVYDKQANAAQLQKSDVLAAVGTSGVAGASQFIAVDSAMNLSNRDRFLIICDKTITLDAQHPVGQFVIYKKLRLPVIYNTVNSAASGWGMIQTGALWLLAISDEDLGWDADAAATGVLANAPMSKYGNCRIRYTDM